MKLELNMYVRTKDGYISQYKYYDTTNAYMEKLLCIPLSNGTFANIEDIVKASYNIIDLIEEGDYVNGYPIYEIVEYEDDTRAIVIGDDNKSIIWKKQDVKTVITHEQMEQMAYKVGD